MTAKKGEPEGIVTTLMVDDYVIIPPELIEKLGWEVGDEIDVSLIENCFEFGEVQSIILRNLTKEKT